MENLEYLTSKELAKKWGVSSTRIVVMAKKGQIKDATLIGKTWLFPIDVEKPHDGRKTKSEDEHTFHFPLHFPKNGLDSSYSNDERIMYEQIDKLNSLSFDEPYQVLNNLYQTTRQNSVKCGCLYYLISIDIYKKRFDEALKFFDELSNSAASDKNHKKELSLLVYDAVYYFKGNKVLHENIDDYLGLHKECYIHILIESLYRTAIKCLDIPEKIDTVPYEIFLNANQPIIHDNINIYSCILLCLIYIMKNRNDLAKEKIEKAFEISYKTNSIYLMASYYRFYVILIPDIVGKYPEEFINKIKHYSSKIAESMNAFTSYINSMQYPDLNDTDYEYITYLNTGNLSYKEIAELRGVSEQAVSKKYKKICEKFGVKTKKSLIKKCCAMLYLRAF